MDWAIKCSFKHVICQYLDCYNGYIVINGFIVYQSGHYAKCVLIAVVLSLGVFCGIYLLLFACTCMSTVKILSDNCISYDTLFKCLSSYCYKDPSIDGVVDFCVYVPCKNGVCVCVCVPMCYSSLFLCVLCILNFLHLSLCKHKHLRCKCVYTTSLAPL